MDLVIFGRRKPIIWQAWCLHFSILGAILAAWVTLGKDLIFVAGGAVALPMDTNVQLSDVVARYADAPARDRGITNSKV